MVNKIWVLFSVSNEYDQPENNLEAWWVGKPTLDMLVEYFKTEADTEYYKKHSLDKKIRKILNGEEESIVQSINRYTDFRLEEVKEGKYKGVTHE